MALILFTDGACSGNPGPGGWGFIFKSSQDYVREGGGREAPTTNNRMELMAVIRGLELVSKTESKPSILSIYLDSKYVLEGATLWLPKWKRTGWQTSLREDVKNKDLWEALDRALQKVLGLGIQVKWIYVRGHAGIAANERCDEIAVSYTEGRDVYLYEGPLHEYSVSLDVSKIAETNLAKSSKKSGPATYLSVVEGKIFRDKTWSECEARVKNRKGVKYKKIYSPEEEAKVLRSWGIKNS